MVVFELQYFPPVSFVSALFKHTYVCLDIYEYYRKMSFRNRCMIAGAGGIISLSIPLEDGRNQRLPVNEVLISATENWQLKHLRSIDSSYRKAPFYDHYRDQLNEIYAQPYRRLADWNLYCLDWLEGLLKWPAVMSFSESRIVHGTAGIADLRDQVLPRNFRSWNRLAYRQVFEERTGFIPNLSILDLLFNVGPAAAGMLKSLAWEDEK